MSGCKEKNSRQIAINSDFGIGVAQSQEQQNTGIFNGTYIHFQ